MLGSDYPYDMAMMDCVAHVRALKISDADKAAILGNARKLFLRERPDMNAKTTKRSARSIARHAA